ncbi:unnamed protein product [Blepharisma stoltei]|uniref:Uncharacterized protein n=1 Tax=Blepharisma stoltei TaxID=1481888 RepID=A0AAU9IEP6_9CILI|nr:unnamed protein product [Blepharisma stoltei]
MDEILSPESEVGLPIEPRDSSNEISADFNGSPTSCNLEPNEQSLSSQKYIDGAVISCENTCENFQNQSNKESGQEILSNSIRSPNNAPILADETANEVEFQTRSDRSFNADERRQISAIKSWKMASPSKNQDSAIKNKMDVFQVTVDLSTPSGTLTGKNYLPSRHGSGHEEKIEHQRSPAGSLKIPILTKRSDSTREGSVRSTISRPESSDRTICFKCLLQ